MSLTQEAVFNQLKQIKYPGFSRDIVSFGLIRGVFVEGVQVDIHMRLSANNPEIVQTIETEAEQAIRNLAPTARVVFHTQVDTPAAVSAQNPLAGRTPIQGVRHILAVASGKGGVGKSTVASNLALAFQHNGLRVGLCDCDLYGPSMGLMFAVNENPTATDDDRINPIEQYGLKLMSMGFLLSENAPAVLRGPMVTRYVTQFLRNVAWGELDVLVLDLPPGTGDIPLTILQTVPLFGGILVTTPQEVALIDVHKAASMFHKLESPITGIIENMSYFICPDTGKRYDIFGKGGGQKEAERLGVPLLAQIPIDLDTRTQGDAGKPIVHSHPDSPISQTFIQTAKKLAEMMG